MIDWAKANLIEGFADDELAAIALLLESEGCSMDHSDSAFWPDVATRLGVANHYGHAVRGDGSREDAAGSALYLSKVMPGQHFLVRANRPGYVAEPDKAGKRCITETGAPETGLRPDG
jgi:hypothetical protein